MHVSMASWTLNPQDTVKITHNGNCCAGYGNTNDVFCLKLVPFDCWVAFSRHATPWFCVTTNGGGNSFCLSIQCWNFHCTRTMQSIKEKQKLTVLFNFIVDTTKKRIGNDFWLKGGVLEVILLYNMFCYKVCWTEELIDWCVCILCNVYCAMFLQDATE